MVSFSPRFISASDGTRLRTGVFEPEKKSGRICVLLSGQTEFIDKYNEVIGELNARGFTVATFDWRGQGGSARALSDPLKSHVGDFAEYDDDLASFLDQVVTPISPAPPLVLAHSLGGHIALRALHDRPGLFRAAVLTAPMLAVSTRGYPDFLVRIVPVLYDKCGRGDDFAWGMAERDPFLVDFTTQLCTTDEKRFARTQAVLKANPALRLAGPTWHWISAAYRSMKQQTRPVYAEAIKAPVMIVGAGRDRIVLTGAEHEFAAQLPSGLYVELQDSEHEILMEVDSIRARFWKEFDGFVEKNIA
jgi:lysophospholipase